MSATVRRSGPGWYHGWNIIAVCVIAGIAASALPVSGFSLFLHNWAADLHVSFSTLQIGVSGMGIGCAVLAPVGGMLTDRFPARNVLAGGLLGMAVFCIAMSYVIHVWEYLVLYATLLPMSVICATTIPANAVVMRWFVRRLGFALGLTSLGLSIAGIIMPPLIAAIMPGLGWRLIWRFTGIIIAVVIVPMVLLVVKERPAEHDGTHYLSQDGALAIPHGDIAHGGGSALSWREILSRRYFWLRGVAYVTMLSVYGGVG